VVIDFITYNDLKTTSACYGASMIARDRNPEFIRIKGAMEINNALEASRQSIISGDEASLKKQYEILSEKLWKPLAAALPQNTKKIYIGADGPLNFLSFATLQDGKGNFLGEDYDIAYVGSERDLLRKSARTAEKTLALYANPEFSKHVLPAVSTNAMAIRAVDLKEFSNVQLPPLPGTKLEAKAVSSVVREFQWKNEEHLGADATKASIMKVKSPTILHLATHGFFLGGRLKVGDGERGMKVAPVDLPVAGDSMNVLPTYKDISPMRQSGVALTGGQSTLQAWGRGEFPDPSNDGILTAEEVAGLDLNGTWLVTLSACETGVGQVQSGEGVFGLRRAFMMAGAQNLLMTLWPVSDEVTPKIMADFYSEALKTGDAAGSLAKVQRDWLVKLRKEKGLLAAVRDAGPFAMVVMANPNAKQ
jgi:CHAT domain-containing protein